MEVRDAVEEALAFIIEAPANRGEFRCDTGMVTADERTMDERERG